MTGWPRLRTKVGRHYYWARTQGVRRLVEEDQLDPRERLGTAYRKWRWRQTQGASPGAARPVYLVGVQRSGTNMLARGLEALPEFEVHNENDRAAFRRYRLRSDADVAGLVRASRHRYVLFKPLCDSHDVARLLDELPVPTAGRALWAYRDVDGRARSALAKFGGANLDALRAIAAGTADHTWQAQGMSADSRALLARLDPASMTPQTAAALFWYLRNRLFFELGLHERTDVLLSSYDDFVARPEVGMRAICCFLDLPYRPDLVAHVEARDAPGAPPLVIDPAVRELCTGLRSRLDAVAAAWRDRLVTATG